MDTVFSFHCLVLHSYHHIICTGQSASVNDEQHSTLFTIHQWPLSEQRVVHVAMKNMTFYRQSVTFTALAVTSLIHSEPSQVAEEARTQGHLYTFLGKYPSGSSGSRHDVTVTLILFPSQIEISIGTAIPPCVERPPRLGKLPSSRKNYVGAICNRGFQI